MNEMHSAEAEREEIATDARHERRLIWQALLAAAIVVVIVVIRELYLR